MSNWFVVADPSAGATIVFGTRIAGGEIASRNRTPIPGPAHPLVVIGKELQIGCGLDGNVAMTVASDERGLRADLLFPDGMRVTLFNGGMNPATGWWYNPVGDVEARYTLQPTDRTIHIIEQHAIGGRVAVARWPVEFPTATAPSSTKVTTRRPSSIWTSSAIDPGPGAREWWFQMPFGVASKIFVEQGDGTWRERELTADESRRFTQLALTDGETSN